MWTSCNWKGKTVITGMLLLMNNPHPLFILRAASDVQLNVFRTTKWLDWESNQVKNNPEEKNVVVVLADFQVLLVAAETGIDRNKSRLCYFQMHCSWLREECDEPCLWLDQVPLLVAALLEPGWDRAPRVEGRAWGWKGLWVWSCSGVRPRPSR